MAIYVFYAVIAAAILALGGWRLFQSAYVRSNRAAERARKQEHLARLNRQVTDAALDQRRLSIATGAIHVDSHVDANGIETETVFIPDAATGPDESVPYSGSPVSGATGPEESVSYSGSPVSPVSGATGTISSSVSPSWHGAGGDTGPMTAARLIGGATGPARPELSPEMDALSREQVNEMDAMSRRHVAEMEEMSHRHIQAAEALLRAARERTQADGNLQQTIRGFDMAGIRLPHNNKAAFSARELFEQQSDMRTHDQGLQVVLNTLHSVVSTFTGCEDVPLRDYNFVMNFANAAGPDSKRFSVRMRTPIQGQVELVQQLRPGQFNPSWEVALDGQRIHIVDLVTVPRVRPVRPAGREDRVIEIS